MTTTHDITTHRAAQGAPKTPTPMPLHKQAHKEAMPVMWRSIVFGHEAARCIDDVAIENITMRLSPLPLGQTPIGLTVHFDEKYFDFSACRRRDHGPA